MKNEKDGITPTSETEEYRIKYFPHIAIYKSITPSSIDSIIFKGIIPSQL